MNLAKYENEAKLLGITKETHSNGNERFRQNNLFVSKDTVDTLIKAYLLLPSNMKKDETKAQKYSQVFIDNGIRKKSPQRYKLPVTTETTIVDFLGHDTSTGERYNAGFESLIKISSEAKRDVVQTVIDARRGFRHEEDGYLDLISELIQLKGTHVKMFYTRGFTFEINGLPLKSQKGSNFNKAIINKIQEDHADQFDDMLRCMEPANKHYHERDSAPSRKRY
ncbi:hypothetical protein ACFL1H_07240 [Nanoarchaeota archaeon]